MDIGLGIATAAFAVVLAAAIGFGVAWNNGLGVRLFPLRWGVVVKGLAFRSGRIHPKLIRGVLIASKMKVILNLCGKGRKSDAEDIAAAELGVEVCYYPLRGDGTGAPEDYVAAVAKLAESVSAGRPALVHCAAGAQRTGGAVALYRMLVEGVSPAEAMDEMMSYGWDPVKDGAMADYINGNMRLFMSGLKAKGVAVLPSEPPRLASHVPWRMLRKSFLSTRRKLGLA